MAQQFCLPCLPVNFHYFSELRSCKIEPVPIHITVTGHLANSAFYSRSNTVYSFNNPFQYSHIIFNSGPLKIAILIFPKPVYANYPGGIGQISAKLKPVIKVVSHVITAKRQHCKKISSYFTCSPNVAAVVSEPIVLARYTPKFQLNA